MGTTKTSPTFTAQFYIKDPDVFWELCDKLKISETKRKRHFEFGEYATLEIVFDKSLNIIGGRVVPL